MDLAGFVVQFLNGLSEASSLFLVAVGLSLIFGVTRIVNFAHGSLYMLGIYVAYSIVQAMGHTPLGRSEEHTSELQSLMRISYAVFCLKKKTKHLTKQI